jgi:hypothetical protein
MPGLPPEMKNADKCRAPVSAGAWMAFGDKQKNTAEAARNTGSLLMLRCNKMFIVMTLACPDHVRWTARNARRIGRKVFELYGTNAL